MVARVAADCAIAPPIASVNVQRRVWGPSGSKPPPLIASATPPGMRSWVAVRNAIRQRLSLKAGCT
eukprot:555434-Rhodomonas_salina.2